jgi:hypothetical protein
VPTTPRLEVRLTRVAEQMPTQSQAMLPFFYQICDSFLTALIDEIWLSEDA